MNFSRRDFIAALAATGAGTMFAGCNTPALKSVKLGKPALQLYSIRDYIGGKKKVGLAKSLEEVAKIGYQAVEFAGYYGFKPEELKKMLDDNGLKACGTHVGRGDFSPEKIKATCEFNLAYGNNLIICPGGGNFPGKDEKLDDFMKMLVEFYNKAAETAATYGCKIGLHNHTGEFDRKLSDGTTYWDYFFSHTTNKVQMEQDVGWTTCAGADPCVQYKKYPHRSVTLHAKENGMGRNVKSFDAILGQPGKPDATPVNWDALFPATDADGVEWYVVECERHCDELMAVQASFDFLKSKGRV